MFLDSQAVLSQALLRLPQCEATTGDAATLFHVTGHHDARGQAGEETLAESFWAVARQLRETSKESLSPWDIRLSQLRALQVLGRHGTMRLSELSDHLHIAARSVTEVADGLETRGLARRRPDPDDRRATLVELTGRGSSLLDERSR